MRLKTQRKNKRYYYDNLAYCQHLQYELQEKGLNHEEILE